MNEWNRELTGPVSGIPVDPRNRPGCDPTLFPKCDGMPFPSVLSFENDDRIKLLFLNAYYKINQASAALQDVRKAAGADGCEGERAALQGVEKALTEKDALEDVYDSSGKIPEPVVERGVVIDLKFAASDGRSRQTLVLKSTKEFKFSLIGNRP